MKKNIFKHTLSCFCFVCFCCRFREYNS